MAHVEIDLHTHTTASDGTHTPAELVARAARRGVRVLGIADHDTLDGIAGAQAAGRELGVEIVPGVEFSTRHERAKHFVGIHLLGYFINPAHPALLEMMGKIKQGRLEQKSAKSKNCNHLGLTSR
ncbi:MAG: PHP domain-containing protein [Chloroflexi bacterium]|nr:MAG: PHP domain-containing protein [Chloroflexota bacterium]